MRNRPHTGHPLDSACGLARGIRIRIRHLHHGGVPLPLPLVLALALTLLVLATTATAHAHPMGPSSLQLDEHSRGVASARFQQPAAATLSPRWPPHCTATLRSSTVERDVSVEHFDLACGGTSLAGTVLGVDGLADRDTIALVRVRLAGGRVAHDILGPSHPRFTIPASSSWLDILLLHARLDHLLFILGLLLIVPGLRARAVTLTAFTAGHSVTLALAVLGVVRVPAAPVEVLIALTLVAVAVQALDPDALAPRHRHTWLLAAAFGLIHGLGFAGALTGAGLPADDLPLALAGFNLGIELGQLALVAAYVIAATLVTTAFHRAAAFAPLVRVVAAYAIGGLAAMWCLERTWAALG